MRASGLAVMKMTGIGPNSLKIRATAFGPVPAFNKRAR